jgi:hypothetical protein
MPNKWLVSKFVLYESAFRSIIITWELIVDKSESTLIFFLGRRKPIRSKKRPKKTKNEPNQRMNFHQRLENFGRWDGIKYLYFQKESWSLVRCSNLLILKIFIFFTMILTIIKIVEIRFNTKISHTSNSDFHNYLLNFNSIVVRVNYLFYHNILMLKVVSFMLTNKRKKKECFC